MSVGTGHGHGYGEVVKEVSVLVPERTLRVFPDHLEWIGPPKLAGNTVGNPLANDGGTGVVLQAVDEYGTPVSYSGVVTMFLDWNTQPPVGSGIATITSTSTISVTASTTVEFDNICISDAGTYSIRAYGAIPLKRQFSESSQPFTVV